MAVVALADKSRVLPGHRIDAKDVADSCYDLGIRSLQKYHFRTTVKTWAQGQCERYHFQTTAVCDLGTKSVRTIPLSDNCCL